MNPFTPTRMPRITLKTVAEEAGVSVATVSLALRGQGKLAAGTVQRIREAADRLGYRPDPMLASLASRRFRSGEQAQGLPVALLEFPPFAGELTSQSLKYYRNHLMTEARVLGYAPQVYTKPEMDRYGDFLRLLYHRGTVGAILSGQPDVGLFANPEPWRNLALIQCGRYRTSLPVNTVRPNIYEAIKLGFEEARARGYRRIGFAIGRHPEILDDDLARLGAAKAFVETQLSPRERIPPFFESLADHDQMIAWVKKYQPDVCIGFSLGLYYDLKKAGFPAPDSIGYIALHGTPEGHVTADGTTIACLDQARSEIARQAILMLDQMVRHNERGLPAAPRQLLVQASFLDGVTVRPRQEAIPAEAKNRASRPLPEIGG
ncbi:MAG: LacI family DNA-binding transcriptional regulator [Opitutales bacterium]